MIPLATLLAFAGVAALITIMPGVDTLLVLRTATFGGRRGGWGAALGIALGCLVWGGAVAVGLGAVMAGHPALFAAIRAAGALYLAVLGWQTLIRRGNAPLPEGSPAKPLASAGHAFRQGLLTNLLNPKVGLFYVTFLPQFLPRSTATFAALGGLTLASVHVALTLAWFAAIILATAPLGRWLARPATVLWLDRVCGVLFIGFGVRLALERA